MLTGKRRARRIYPVVLLGGLVYTASTQAQLPGLERLVMPGPVVESHAVNEDECASCHVNFSPESQVQLCLDCHLEIAEDLQTEYGVPQPLA